MGSAFETLLEKVRGTVDSVTVQEAHSRLNNGNQVVLIDVREREDFAEGFIPSAQNVPRGFLELQIEGVVNERSASLLVYGHGGQAPFAARDLASMGYENVAYIEGGFEGWVEAGYTSDRDRALSKAEQFRYARHLLVPEVGERGQGVVVGELLDTPLGLVSMGDVLNTDHAGLGDGATGSEYGEGELVDPIPLHDLR